MRGNINMGSNNVVQTGGISSGGTMSDGGAVLTQASSVRLNVKGQNQIECDGGSVFIRRQANMDGKKIVSMADPTNPQDAATKAYVDSKAGNIVKEPGVSVAYSGFYACPGSGSVKIAKITGTMFIYATCSIAGEQRSDVQVLTETIKANTNASTGSFRVSVDGSGNVSLDTVSRNQPFAGFAIIWG